jgi:hypothetical protein
MEEDKRLFAALVEEARAYRAERSGGPLHQVSD